MGCCRAPPDMLRSPQPKTQKAVAKDAVSPSRREKAERHAATPPELCKNIQLDDIQVNKAELSQITDVRKRRDYVAED
ncbi:hypothetical protein EYF80_010197 [Liparis tanakae]|uniref:Uncharacterized protein n=1 Tax=Liparis tanakae TaxID=230148 RepID=A0A4Z2INZ0_9TELE|nr:hypothetical protein EYF80_010197 [Liparis tanakae]